MFRKLVSNLPFSPALVGQLGFYARRLRKEELTRRIGLVFTVLALIVQSFAVFSPPEQALASSASDVIPGGVQSIQQIVATYDAGAIGQNDFKDLMDYLGITRHELVTMYGSKTSVCSSDKEVISFGRQHHYSAAEGELVHNIPRQTGGFSTFYSVPLYRFDSVHNRPLNCYESYKGESASAGTFWIQLKCGNVQIKKNVQKFPKAHFVAATCKTVQGYAYDERQTNLPVKIYLYFDGPPGKGKQYGPITADQASPTNPAGGNHGFSFAVSEEYQKSTKPVVVWAVMQPLPGWNQANVQFDNTVEIPGNCTPAATPLAECSSLKLIQVDRTRVKFEAKARAEQGATISGFAYTVSSKDRKIVYEKLIQTTNTQSTSEVIDLKNAGEYTAKVVAKTSLGDKTSTDCSKIFSISPIDKCPYIGSGDISKAHPDCLPCPHDKNLWIKDDQCMPKISESKEARNMTKQIANANGTTAGVTDRIEFVLYTTNTGDIPVKTNIEESLADVLEYARLIDAGGGSYNEQLKKISWGNVTIEPQKTEVRRIVVQVLDSIPSTPRGANNPAAYNCVMTNSYGNTIEINVQCPAVKGIETAVKTLPSTGPGENILFGTVLLMMVTYFYARSRQMKKEVLLIRKDIGGGL